jgi:hypothetical protein
VLRAKPDDDGDDGDDHDGNEDDDDDDDEGDDDDDGDVARGDMGTVSHLPVLVAQETQPKHLQAKPFGASSR